MQAHCIADFVISGLWEELSEVDDAGNSEVEAHLDSETDVAPVGPMFAVQTYRSQVIVVVSFLQHLRV
ncbi:hypothetical protein [Roseibium polysiphoniae]|uniref:Uncharacterized protein n=1 Tax=Roseibium polysiphoniae TaxID=2571221 RepID=A0ABR9CEQ1_9HYPH|nr:hypothetical protein [Roseibium polysiphoniae]MBD8878366.1 hypothetical protein [Roseibium polysiphoniae]